jgi:bifunctional non-homologous end joining protein LigD
MERPRYAPMLLATTDKLPVGEDWAYEPKLEGWRMMAYESMGQWSLITRGGRDYTDSFGAVAQQLPLALNNSHAVLDGEMVALGKRSREYRQLLFQPLAARIIYYAFDILELDGESLVREPWSNRHQILERFVTKQANVILVDTYEHTDLKFLQEAARRRSIEGIVAKRKDSLYRPGKRSQDDWLKYRFKQPQPKAKTKLAKSATK